MKKRHHHKKKRNKNIIDLEFNNENETGNKKQKRI
jgi:hypothetical protein